jgi:hypothetical protein
MLKSAWFCLFLMQLSVLAGQQSHNDTLLHKDMDQVVVTAQFSPTDARETVNSVRLINRKTIEQKGASNLQELLQMEANIRISQDPLLGSEISINGLKGENVKILIDGVPVVGRLNGNIDAGQIPLHAIQKLKLLRAHNLYYTVQKLLPVSSTSSPERVRLTDLNQKHNCITMRPDSGTLTFAVAYIIKAGFFRVPDFCSSFHLSNQMVLPEIRYGTQKHSMV